MAEAINRKRAERGEKPMETDSPKVEKTDEEKKDLEGQADEPKDEKKPDPEVEKKVQALEERVQHFEARDAEWSKVTDTLISQRDYYRQLAESVEKSLPEAGFEIDPTIRENLALKSQLQQFQAQQRRAAEESKYREQMEREQSLSQYREEVVSVGQRLARSYPELNPQQNPELASAFFRGWASKGGDAADLERAAKAYVAKVRGARPQEAASMPRTLSGSRAPRAPLPVGRDWSDVRRWAEARHNAR